jgi:hypothetical protein
MSGFYSKIDFCLPVMTKFCVAFTWFLLTTSVVFSQEYRIFIDPKSKVSVYGSTNVNNFVFQYLEIISIEKPVHVKRTNGALKLSGGIINLKVHAFDSGNGIMNKDFRKMMNEDENPFIQVELLSLIPNWQPDGHWKDGKVEIVVEMNQIKKKYIIRCTINNPGSLLIFGKEKIRLTDFELEPPSRMMGMVKVNEFVDFDLSLRFVTDR